MSQRLFRAVCDGQPYTVILCLPGIQSMQFYTVVNSTSLDAGSFTQVPVIQSMNQGILKVFPSIRQSVSELTCQLRKKQQFAR